MSSALLSCCCHDRIFCPVHGIDGPDRETWRYVVRRAGTSTVLYQTDDEADAVRWATRSDDFVVVIRTADCWRVFSNC